MVIQADTEFQTVQFKSDPASISRKYALKKSMDILKKEINELRNDDNLIDTSVAIDVVHLSH